MVQTLSTADALAGTAPAASLTAPVFLGRGNLYRKLLRMALLTAPLIALTNLVTPAIFISTLTDVDMITPPEITPLRFLGGVTIVSISVFVLWCANIALVWAQRENGWTGRRADWLRYALALVVAFVYITIIHEFIDGPRPLEALPTLRWYPYLSIFSTTCFILILEELIISRERNAQLELRRARLEIRHLLSEQSQLRQQIQPHFLFNALSTLNILIGKNTATAQEYAGKLAGFLRDSLRITRRDLHSIGEEIRFLDQFVWLQRVRFGERFTYHLRLSDTTRRTGMLPVCSLQILIENALKHNVLDARVPLVVTIDEPEPGWLRVRNPIRRRAEPLAGTRTGLRNLARRYQLYERTGGFRVEETATDFAVWLKILDE